MAPATQTLAVRLTVPPPNVASGSRRWSSRGIKTHSTTLAEFLPQGLLLVTSPFLTHRHVEACLVQSARSEGVNQTRAATRALCAIQQSFNQHRRSSNLPLPITQRSICDPLIVSKSNRTPSRKPLEPAENIEKQSESLRCTLDRSRRPKYKRTCVKISIETKPKCHP